MHSHPSAPPNNRHASSPRPTHSRSPTTNPSFPICVTATDSTPATRSSAGRVKVKIVGGCCAPSPGRHLACIWLVVGHRTASVSPTVAGSLLAASSITPLSCSISVDVALPSPGPVSISCPRRAWRGFPRAGDSRLDSTGRTDPDRRANGRFGPSFSRTSRERPMAETEDDAPNRTHNPPEGARASLPRGGGSRSSWRTGARALVLASSLSEASPGGGREGVAAPSSAEPGVARKLE